MSISREDVEKVALLARLRLSDAESETLTAQLGDVLSYIQQLDEVDTSSVEPLAHALDLVNVFADDCMHEGLSREQALSTAPKSDDECFLVPAVLGD